MIEDNKDNRQKSDEILKAKKRAMLILQHNDRSRTVSGEALGGYSGALVGVATFC